MSIIIHFIKRKYSTPIHVVTFELSNIEIFYKFNNSNNFIPPDESVGGVELED